MKEDRELYLRESPLDLNQIQRIDKLNLSSIEKHHLRLIAHCLESFKDMKSELKSNSLPSKEEQMAWCLANPNLGNDKEFIELLLQQFDAASKYLGKVAERLRISPMEITIENLILNALDEGQQN